LNEHPHDQRKANGRASVQLQKGRHLDERPRGWTESIASHKVRNFSIIEMDWWNVARKII
jgi:hypothetical protein